MELRMADFQADKELLQGIHRVVGDAHPGRAGIPVPQGSHAVPHGRQGVHPAGREYKKYRRWWLKGLAVCGSSGYRSLAYPWPCWASISADCQMYVQPPYWARGLRDWVVEYVPPSGIRTNYRQKRGISALTLAALTAPLPAAQQDPAPAPGKSG